MAYDIACANPSWSGNVVAGTTGPDTFCSPNVHYPDLGWNAGRHEKSSSEFGDSPGQFVLPLVQERPVDSAGAEIGHVGVGFEPRDGRAQEGVVLAEDGAVWGE